MGMRRNEGLMGMERFRSVDESPHRDYTSLLRRDKAKQVMLKSKIKKVGDR
jgi:hypothetical protein